MCRKDKNKFLNKLNYFEQSNASLHTYMFVESEIMKLTYGSVKIIRCYFYQYDY